MGQILTSIAIYVPAQGETNYDQAFLQGMINLSNHDHSGPPNGIALSPNAIGDHSIHGIKLNADVAGTGLFYDTGVTNTILIPANGIVTSMITDANVTNAKLVNSSVTIDKMNVALGASNTRPAFKMSRNSVSGAAISGVVPYDVIDINQGGFTLNAAAGTAIAPVTGIYHFSANVAFGNPTSSSGTIYFDVGGVQYQQYLINPTVVVNSSSRVTLELNGLIAMTAGDTIKIQYQVGSGTVTIDGIGAGELTSFQGYLIG